MRSIAKLFLVTALFTGSIWAGDQPNGGYTGCTVDCPPPCTENCDPDNGLWIQDSAVDNAVDSETEVDLFDRLVILAADCYQLIVH